MRLFATDLDKTLIPNGSAEYDNSLNFLFSSLEKNNIAVAYISGRSLDSVINAIKEFKLKWPDFIISRVGGEIYSSVKGELVKSEDWLGKIKTQNKNWNIDFVKKLLNDVSELEPQAEADQSEFKISYFITDFDNADSVKSHVYKILDSNEVNANLVMFKDSESRTVYFDVLPFGVNKIEALDFLVNKEGFEDVVFAGDSENDLDVLNSDRKSILVKNATDEVKVEITSDYCYVCQGNEKFNGNYSSGIIEGLMHYGWIESTYSQS
jgi:sucrose-6-phosphatase